MGVLTCYTAIYNWGRAALIDESHFRFSIVSYAASKAVRGCLTMGSAVESCGARARRWASPAE